MKNRSFVAAAVQGVFFLGLMVLLTTGMAHAETLRLDVQLVWGTDDVTAPNPKHHPVDKKLAERLGEGPYRWKNYFKINGVIIDIPDGETKAGIVMSDECTLDIKNVSSSRVQVKLHGRGKPVLIHTESLTKNGLLILAGEADNKTAWMVIIRKTDASVTKLEKAVSK